MRYSYGVMDQKKHPDLQTTVIPKTDDLLIFPTTDYRKWHSNITEYIDALFQLNAHNDSIDVDNLNLALGGLF